MADPLLRKLSLGEVLDVSFGIYRSRFLPLFLIAAITQAIPISLSIYLADPTTMSTRPLMALLLFLSSIVLTHLAVAASTLVVSRAYLGREMDAMEALRSSTPFILRLMGISFMMALLVFCGLICLIIPGFIMFVGLCLSSAVAVLESPISATKAMGRSWELTKGQRFKIFVAMLVPLFLLMVPGMALGILMVVFGKDMLVTIQVLSAVTRVFFYPFFYVVIGVCYYDQRIRKEGFDLELMAEATQPG